MLTDAASEPKAVISAPSLNLLRRRGRIMAFLALLVLVVPTIILATSLGSTYISFPTVAKILLNKLPFVSFTEAWPGTLETVVFDIRLVRAILAAAGGSALAVAGATYQGLFRNPLADPYLIGVAQGAGLGAIIGFTMRIAGGEWGLSLVSLFAFLGGTGAAVFVYLIGRVGRTLPMTTLILAGVALGAFLQAITSYLMITSQDTLHGTYAWLLGGFTSPEWSEVKIMLPVVTVGIVLIWLYGQRLNIMQLDDDQARQLGVNVESTKRILLLAATLITAVAVCFGGVIGFVGIIVPHAVRLVWGPDYRFLLPLSALLGAIFLVLADILARTVMSPKELPVGIITAFLGAPFFLYLLRQRKRALF